MVTLVRLVTAMVKTFSPMNSKSIATMKNLFTRLMLVAVVAMGFVACQNGLEEVTILPNEAEKVTISITTESEVESRTAIDEANKSFVWSAGDKIMVFQDAVAVESEEAVIDGAKATFKASFDVADGTFAYNAIYPSSAYITDSFKLETTDVEPIVRVTTPSTQTSTADSYDPEADLLIAQPTSATQEEATTMSMSFKRLVAIGKMTLKGLNTDEPINSVTISAPGKVLAGRSSFNYATGQVVEYGYNSYGESSLTIKYEEALTNNSPVFFTCLPCEFVAGDTFTVSAVCGDTTFTREVTIPEGGNSLLFTDGDLTTFTVNMSSATETSSFSVKTGDYVIMVQYTESSTVYNKMMKVNNSTSTTAYQYYTDYTGKTDVNSITTDIENIWTITNNGNGTYYIQPKDSEYYLSWRNGGNTACLSTDALALSITENGDYVKIVVNETTERVLSYNSSSPRFAFYKGTQKQDLLLIPAEVDTTPRFTVTPTEQSIGAEGGDIQFTVTSYNGAVVTAESSDTTWLTIDDTFKATALANDSEQEREATITFSADGCDDVVVVTVSQAKQVAEGEATTYSYTFTSKQFSANGTKALGVLSWALDGNGNYWGYDATKGQQFGSGNNPYKNLTLSTSDFKSEVNKIVLETSGGSSVNATCTITVGGTQIGEAIKITSTSTVYTFEATAALKGEIVISYSQTSSKAIYIKSIAIN